jgi:CRP/FNR family transcriptional regulator, cyclic AMP receptor protein
MRLLLAVAVGGLAVLRIANGGTPVDHGVWPDKRRRKFAAVDADIRAAVEASHLRALPPDALDELMLGSVRRRISAGSVTHREAGSAPYLELLMSGVVRAFVTAPDGRALTVRYCHRGALIGVYTLFARPLVTSGSTQALVESELVQMSPAVARRLAGTDVRIARALLTELSERVKSFITEIPGGAFTTVRQRVARHLLDLASPGMSAHGELHVLVSQRELADAVGTVREVVVRVLREFRAEELIRTERDRIVIVDPVHLSREQG